MSLLRRILAMVMPGVTRQSGPPAVLLRVTDADGRVLADVANAQRSDYRISVSLPSGAVMIDLHGHYERFIKGGGRHAYRGTDAACNTYVKFGECIQDRRELHILIQSSAQRGSL